MPATAHRRNFDAPLDVSALMARLDNLERRFQGGGGGGGKGGKGDGRRGDDGRTERAPRAAATAGGGGARGRPGDWECPACRAFPCFSRTTSCYKCGEPRRGGGEAAGAAGGRAAQTAARESPTIARPRPAEAYLGPIGADGSRPMLGRWAAGAAGGAGTPTRSGRLGGAVARDPAVGGAVHGDGTVGTQSRQSGGGGASQRDDASGFQDVRQGTPMAAAERAAREMGDAERRVPKRARNYWADLSEQPEDEDDQAMQGLDDSAAQDGGRDGDDGGQPAPEAEPAAGEDRCQAEATSDDRGDGQEDEEALRAEWQKYVQVCRGLERDRSTPARLLADARAQRDEAERKWRSARTPHPLHKRMRWAEAELRDAESKQAAHQRELDAHVEQAARRTRDLEARLRIDVARTARKRAALLALHREGAPCPAPPRAERAARIAATGMGSELIPALVAAVERLAMPLGDDADAFRHELRGMAVAATRIEGLLRDAFEQVAGDDGPATFDIGDGGQGDDGDIGATAMGNMGSGGGAAAQRPATPAAAAVTRWMRQQDNGPWRRATSSVAAQEQARRLLTQTAMQPEAGDCPEAGGSQLGAGTEAAAATLAGGDGQPLQPGSTTNDLAEAERRDRQIAEAQFQREVLHRHGAEQRQQGEDLQRQQRWLQQQEELRRHQEQLQQANEARAAEEARQRDALIAKMSPAELARAAELHAQQAAVGSRAFGSREASELAGLAHQRHVQGVADATGASEERAAVDALMAMSPEQFAEWERDQQGRTADGTGW